MQSKGGNKYADSWAAKRGGNESREVNQGLGYPLREEDRRDATAILAVIGHTWRWKARTEWGLVRGLRLDAYRPAFACGLLHFRAAHFVSAQV